jgi:hypothetical protein
MGSRSPTESLAFAPRPPAAQADSSPELAPEYLELVARLEAHPENRDGADKSWVHRLLAWADAHHAGARPR